MCVVGVTNGVNGVCGGCLQRQRQRQRGKGQGQRTGAEAAHASESTVVSSGVYGDRRTPPPPTDAVDRCSESSLSLGTYKSPGSGGVCTDEAPSPKPPSNCSRKRVKLLDERLPLGLGRGAAAVAAFVAGRSVARAAAAPSLLFFADDGSGSGSGTLRMSLSAVLVATLTSTSFAAVSSPCYTAHK